MKNHDFLSHLLRGTTTNSKLIGFKIRWILIFISFCMFLYVLIVLNEKRPFERSKEELLSVGFHSDWNITKIPHPIHIYTTGNYGNEIAWIQVGRINLCPIECHFSTFASSGIGKDADAIVFPGPYIGTPNRSERKKAITILYSTESDEIYPTQRNAYFGVQSYFDITMSYHSKSDSVIREQQSLNKRWHHFPLSYAAYDIPSYFTPMKEKKKDKMAAIFVSNCAKTTSNRMEILRLLREQNITVDIFGKCNATKTPEEVGCPGEVSIAQKLCVISQYAFNLAFENSIDESYVTEKYFEALKAGSVPIYLGAPNIEQFDPLENASERGISSVIPIKSIHDVPRVANLMKFLFQNQTELDKYLTWKKEPPSKRLKSLVASAFEGFEASNVVCDLCELVAKLKFVHQLW